MGPDDVQALRTAVRHEVGKAVVGVLHICDEDGTELPVGESGTIGSTPAIHNAVVDAVAHLGVTHIDMPTSPLAIWEALAAASN